VGWATARVAAKGAWGLVRRRRLLERPKQFDQPSQKWVLFRVIGDAGGYGVASQSSLFLSKNELWQIAVKVIYT